MKVNVQSVRFKADHKLLEFCEKKVKKLLVLFDGVIGAEVTLRLDKDGGKENKVAEIMVSVPANENLFAKKSARTFEESVDMSVEALRRQLRKYKGKLKSK